MRVRNIRAGVCQCGYMCVLVSVVLLAGWLFCVPQSYAAAGFTDVSSNSWYVKDGYLQYVVDNGIMMGTKNPDGTFTGKFEPDKAMTRGQAATVLYRMANPESLATTNPSEYGKFSRFWDVRTSYYYTAAIEWCADYGIVEGYRNAATQELTGAFGPEDLVTREQLAAMLYRFACCFYGQGGVAVDSTGYDAMPDSGQVHLFADDAMRWCYSVGILTGSVLPEGTFLMPREVATRAQVAKMLTVMRLHEAASEHVAYVLLYTDGELVFQMGSRVDPGRTLLAAFTDFEDQYYSADDMPPWAAYSRDVQRVTVRNSIRPVSLAFWFFEFSNCSYFDLGLLDVSNVRDMTATFSGCAAESLDLTDWDVSNSTTMYQMFSNCENLQEINTTGWNPRSVEDFSFMFTNCSALKFVDLSSWNMENAQNMACMFQCCTDLEAANLSNWNVSTVLNMCDMFSYCKSLKRIEFGIWNSHSVTTIADLFLGCQLLEALDLSSWDVSSVEDMSSAFAGCFSLCSLDLSGWNMGNVRNAACMFSECFSLEELDLSGWNIRSLSNCRYMFYECSSLASLDLSDWNTASVGDAGKMFDGCVSLASVSLGEAFSLQSALPSPSEAYIIGATGLWYGSDGMGFAPSDIPVGKVDRYTAIPSVLIPEVIPPADVDSSNADMNIPNEESFDGLPVEIVDNPAIEELVYEEATVEEMSTSSGNESTDGLAPIHDSVVLDTMAPLDFVEKNDITMSDMSDAIDDSITEREDISIDEIEQEEIAVAA